MGFNLLLRDECCLRIRDEVEFIDFQDAYLDRDIRRKTKRCKGIGSKRGADTVHGRVSDLCENKM